MKNNIVICAIAKKEHLYINDWVKYHLSIGFDHIYIFDNDDLGAEFIGDYIDKEFINNITIIDVRGIKKKEFQSECYNRFYKENMHSFSWCAFIDIDEYIIFQEWKDIKEMLSDHRFDNFVSIKLAWHMYGDDDTIKRDLSISPLLFFKKHLKDHIWNIKGKQITRGSLTDVTIGNHFCHFNSKVEKQCTTAGTICVEKNNAFDTNRCLYSNAYINHYMTKTLDEFLNQKFQRSDVVFDKRILDLDYYWNINKKTPEKLEYIRNFLNKNGMQY